MNEFGHTPLHQAVIDQDLELVKNLIVSGTDLNSQDNFGSTPLLIAVCRHGMLEIPKTLIHAGANTNMPDHQGAPPLLASILKDDHEMTKLLLNAKADPNFNMESTSLLHIAAVDASTHIIELLLRHRADRRYKNSKGQTPIKYLKRKINKGSRSSDKLEQWNSNLDILEHYNFGLATKPAKR